MGVDCIDLRLCHGQLRLFQFDNAAQTKLVPSLRKVECLACLGEQLSCDGDSFERSLCVEHGGAYIPGDGFAQAANILLRSTSTQISFPRACREEEAIEDGNAQVNARRPVPGRSELIGADGSPASSSQG